MLRSAFDHPKLKRLCQLLGVPQYQAVGLLESIWHFAARYAPQGDIGRFSNDDIGTWIGCPDMDRHVQALIKTGWLDTCGKSRLVVHDWHEHADQSVKKLLQRKELEFLSIHVHPCPSMSILPEPVPVPVPGPAPAPGPVPDCAEPATPPTALEVPAELVGLELYEQDRKLCRHWPELRVGWQIACPGIDVVAQVRLAHAWEVSNPTKRKKDRPRFLAAWLFRAQDRIGGGAGSVEPAWAREKREQKEKFDAWLKAGERQIPAGTS